MNNNINIHEGQLKSDVDSDRQMEMMMMTAMMQMPNDPTNFHQSPHHHHHHHNAAAASPPFMTLPSTVAPQPLFPLHQDHLILSGSTTTTNYISKRNNNNNNNNNNSSPSSSMAAMREMIFRMAVMQPVHIDPESVKPPKRRNVRISKDPQSVAARHRRERISEKIRILQRLVPGGTKMDTASMLDEAIHYVKFLKTQVQSLERVSVANASTSDNRSNCSPAGIGFPVAMSTGTYVSPRHDHHHHAKGFSNGHFGDVFD